MGKEYGAYLCLDERPTSNFAAIVASIRQRADLHRPDRVRLFVVDYMQILQGSGMGNDLRDRDVQMFMAMLSRTFFNLTQEFGIGIIALSQFNRERDDPEPTLNRLRDSNQIGDAADDIWLLYRPEAYGKCYSTDPTVDPAGTALILVQKRRDGPTGHFFMGFDAPCTRFYPFADNAQIPRRHETAGRSMFV